LVTDRLVIRRAEHRYVADGISEKAFRPYRRSASEWPEQCLVGAFLAVGRGCAWWKEGQTVRSRNNEPMTFAVYNKAATRSNGDDSAF
jgi:hypothetical protein